MLDYCAALNSLKDFKPGQPITIKIQNYENETMQKRLRNLDVRCVVKLLCRVPSFIALFLALAVDVGDCAHCAWHG